MPTMKSDSFPDIIGQEKAKRKLEFYRDGYKATSVIPNLMFIAPKGCGKTLIAKELGKNLVKRDEPKAKSFVE